MSDHERIPSEYFSLDQYRDQVEKELREATKTGPAIGLTPAEMAAKPTPDWNKCDHFWETKPGDWDSPFEQVRCLRCGCPGERYETGSIYWPVT